MHAYKGPVLDICIVVSCILLTIMVFLTSFTFECRMQVCFIMRQQGSLCLKFQVVSPV